MPARLSTRLERLTSPPRLRLFGGLLLAGQVLAVVLQVTTAPTLIDASGVAVGRDFIAFYTAGHVVARGEGRRLYDYPTQARAQAELLAPATREGTAFFTNPAFFALPYALLAALPYRTAFLIHALLMGGLVVLGLRLLARKLPLLQAHWKLAALLGLAWLPMANGVLGGQNAALTFALLAAAYVGVSGRRPWLAGLALGLLLEKPQYALPMLALMLVSGEWAVVWTAAVVAVGEYVAGAAVAGWDWPARLADAIRFFAEQERVANGPTLISIPEWFDFNLGARWLGLAIAGVLWLGIAAAWVRHRLRGDKATLWALTVTALLLASLHTQHYDTAVLLLPVLLLLDARARRGEPLPAAATLLLAAAYFVYPVFLLGRSIGVQPLILLPLGMLAWATLEFRGPRQAEAA